MKKKLAIFGKMQTKITVEKVKEEGFEVWMCGTDERQGGDLYFELHGLDVPHVNVCRKIPEKVYQQNLPINNTVSALVVLAWLEGYSEINVYGCPMAFKDEYIEQKPALAYALGFVAGHGISVYWPDLPKNLDYGKTTN